MIRQRRRAIYDDQKSAARPRASLDQALDLVRFLRTNCPWDAAQTPTSLTPHLVEETHEVIDAIEDEDDDALAGELGDLLLNLAFQIVLAEERGAFTASTVVNGLEDKMQRRHPHLYGLGEAEEWEKLKAREREESRGNGSGPDSILEGVPRGLDPLARAHRIQERVSGVGFDWDDAGGAFEKVVEEIEEVREALEAGTSQELEEELGDLLFAVVNLTRLAGFHAMTALQRANRKFTDRFEALEARAAANGVVLGEAPLEELDRLWDEVKRGERRG